MWRRDVAFARGQGPARSEHARKTLNSFSLGSGFCQHLPLGKPNQMPTDKRAGRCSPLWSALRAQSRAEMRRMDLWGQTKQSAQKLCKRLMSGLTVVLSIHPSDVSQYPRHLGPNGEWRPAAPKVDHLFSVCCDIL